RLRLSEQRRTGLPHEDREGDRADALEGQQAALEVLPLAGCSRDGQDPPAVIGSQRTAQQRQPRRGGFVVAPITALAQHAHELRVAACGDPGGRVATVLMHDHAPGAGGNRLRNAVAEQEAGQEPLEQGAFIARAYLEAEVAGDQLSSHGKPALRGRTATAPRARAWRRRYGGRSGSPGWAVIRHQRKPAPWARC